MKARDGSGGMFLRLPQDLQKQIAKIVEKRGYQTRQEFIREAIRDALAKEASA